VTILKCILIFSAGISIYLFNSKIPFILAVKSGDHISSLLSDSSIAAGKVLFRNCESCHSVFKDITGPALAGVEKRWSTKEKLYQFMVNPFPFFQSDKYVKSLLKKYGVVTPAYALSRKEFQCILDYIAFEEKRRK